MTGRHRAGPARPRRRKNPRRLAPAVLGGVVGALGVVGGVTVLIPAADPSRVDADTGPASATSPRPTSSPVPVSPVRPPPRPRAGADRPADDRRQRPSAAVADIRVPEEGPGTFEIARGTTEVTGSGDVVTYSVEIEVGLPLAHQEVADIVDDTLADPRGWTAGDARAVQRLPGDADLRVLLATPETTDALCAPLDTGGRLSCRNGDLVVLNAWRWANGAATYGDLDDYRRYLINHEFGHALGNDHASCTGLGDPAPVMVQQTKSLEGCRQNPWPFP